MNGARLGAYPGDTGLFGSLSQIAVRGEDESVGSYER